MIYITKSWETWNYRGQIVVQADGLHRHEIDFKIWPDDFQMFLGLDLFFFFLYCAYDVMEDRRTKNIYHI
jgi:hypothetical protein